MPTIRDEDGQPHPSVYAWRVDDQRVAELLGICKGMVCDGVVNDLEVNGLKRWLAAHSEVLIGYPGKNLAERVVQIMADGRVDDDERKELYELMQDVTGETPEHDQPMNLSARAFFDEPPPTVLFDAKEFVFTGRMLHMSRRNAEQAVMDRGGRVAEHVRVSTDFLVLGPIGSRAWIQSTHGTKLIAAKNRQAEGGRIKIISEEHWLAAIHES